MDDIKQARPKDGPILNFHKRHYTQFHNPKTCKNIHKIFGIQSETSLLINCAKVSSLSIEKWGSSWPENSSSVAQNCCL